MDALKLTIESHTVETLEAPSSFDLSGTSARVGRKAGNDWVLPDPTRHISGHHFDILFQDGQYLLHDRSTNGTFLNGQKDRVVSPYRIAHGDRFKVGPYVLHAELQPITTTTSNKVPSLTPVDIPAASAGGQGKRNVQAPPSGAMLGNGTPAQVHAPRSDTGTASRAQTPDFSRFQQAASEDGARVSQPPVVAPSVAPFSPSPADNAPSPPQQPFGDMPEPPGTELPDDLDLSLDPLPDPADTPAPSTSDGPFNQAEPDPLTGLSPQPVDAPPSVLIPDDDFDTPPTSDTPPDPSDPAPDLVPQTPKPAVPPTLAVSDTLESQPPRGLGESFSDPTPLPTRRPDPTQDAPAMAPAPAAPPPSAAPAENPFLDGFLEGAGIDTADDLDMPLRDLGKILGQCARLCTVEIMQMLQDRANVKLFVTQEDRTMRIADGNNPMKFMPDPEQAFETLFVKPRSGYQTGAEGFENALTDIRNHQAAMIAAMQPAIADVMAGLSPSDIEAETGSGGGMLKGGNKKQWEEFVSRWNARAAAGENGMVDAFVKAYARHYTDALTKF